MAYSFFLVSDNKKVQFPIAPSDLTITVNGRNETVDLMNEGEVNILKSPGLTEVSFTALIPQTTKYPFAANREPIDTFTNFLNDMLEKKKPFRFVVVRTAGNRLLFDTNLKMACEGYNLKESADNGYDVELEIKLKQYRDYGVKTITLVTVSQTVSKTTTSSTSSSTSTTNKSSNSTSASASKNRETASASGRVHTVKTGDTLWGIAKKYYGDGTKWNKIYITNKETIEKVAMAHGKKSSSNGHWIFPGTKLRIP